MSDGFFAVGGNSAAGARAVQRLRAELGLPVTLIDLYEAESIADLVRACGIAYPPVQPRRAAFDAVLPIRPQGRADPLFCFHPGLGVAWCYAALRGLLPDEVPLYGIQAHGITGTQTLPATLDEMALDYVRRVRRIQPAGPYRLLGWSFGGNVAQAVGVLLTEAGEEVSLLAMLDSWSPGTTGFEPAELPGEAELMAQIMRTYGAGGELDSLEPELLSCLARVQANNMVLLHAHKPGLFRGDLLFFEADGSDLGAAADPGEWAPFVTGVIESHPLLAGHYELLAPDAAARVAAHIAPRLIQAPLLTKAPVLTKHRY